MEPKKMTWKEAILTILRERNEPILYSDLADEILRRKMVDSKTATPANTVYTVCFTEMQRPSPEIRRVGKGMFILANPGAVEVDPSQDEESWIQSLGIMWRRDWVRWSSNPKLLGVAPNGTKTVDFCEQRGIYLLYDGARPVYVGRITDRALGKRLNEHVSDRLGARWDRFSWFGLRSVTDEGKLTELPNSGCKCDSFIADLEAVLIETLEPPLNRKRGDDLDAKEYRQVRDEAQEKQKLMRLLEEYVADKKD